MKSKASSTARNALLCLLASLCLPLCLQAQQNKLNIEPPSPLLVKRGATAKEALKVVVLSGFHVNSDKPKDEFLIPLKLTWEEGPLTAKSVTYPKPEELEVGGQNLAVFTGTFPINTEFVASKEAPKGSITVSGKLRYQACNTQMCFRPSTLDVKIPVVIE